MRNPAFPNSIAIDLKTYNSAHRAMLEQLAVWPRIEQLLQGPITVPTEQFLVYSLFRNRDTSTLAELRQAVQSRHDLFSLLLSPTPNSFVAKQELIPGEHRPESQDIGEALGLCLMDKLFKTNEADWKRIPEGAGKTMDYLASDQIRHIELEAKGSFVDDVAKKSSAISKHKASIEAKKAIPGISGGIRIGTIAAVDRNPMGRPKVWLLDPPINAQEREPRATRLIHRIEFILQILKLINPSSSLVAALGTRVTDLQLLSDPFVLNKAPLGLLQADGRRNSEGRHRFFATRSVVADQPAGGVVTAVGETHLFFAGVLESIVELAECQDFDEIMNNVERTGVFEQEVIAFISYGRFHREGLNPNSESVSALRRNGYFEIRLVGNLAYSAGGMVFGWLPRPHDL